MRQFLNVFKFEYTSIIKNKSFIIITAIILTLIIIASCIPSVVSIFAGMKTEEKQKICQIEDRTGNFPKETMSLYIKNMDIETGAVDEKTITRVESGELQFAAIISGEDSITVHRGTSQSFSNGHEEALKEMILDKLKNDYLIDKGFTVGDVKIYSSIEVDMQNISHGKDFSQTFWYSYALLMLLYITLVMYGQMIVTSVATEKSTKTMELLITSAKPTTLLFGKVIGTGLAGLTQFLLIILTAGIALSFNQASWFNFSADAGEIIKYALSSELFIFALIFFVLGFFTYAFVYAAFGSMISRIEEASSVIILPMMLFVSAFLIAIIGMQMPDSTFIHVFSFLPFYSPLVMFMRMCVTDVPWIQVMISLAISTVWMLFMGLMSARIYKVGVMLYGNPPKLGKIIKYAVRG